MGAGQERLSNGLESQRLRRIADATSEVKRLRDVLSPNVVALIEIGDGPGHAEEPVESSGGHPGPLHRLAQKPLAERVRAGDAPDGRRRRAGC